MNANIGTHRLRFSCALPFSTLGITSGVTMLLATAPFVSAQWIGFTDQTGTRMPTGGGQNNSALTTLCPEEKDYAWGDVDHDGDLDLACARKRPLSCTGGRPNVLYMNENGVLIDRTSTKAAAALNGGANGVPSGDGTSQGFLDSTNDRTVVLVDVNNDGWLDMVTATTMSDGQLQYISYPRVYMNLGESGGVWQGFRYEYARIPTMLGTSDPRFCAVAAGDVTGDGYVDLYFVDYDGPEFCYCTNDGGQPGESGDFNDKLLVNQGATNPGFFNDEGTARMGSSLLNSAFGAHCLIADFNGDGIKDVAKINTLTAPNIVRVFTNPPASVGNNFLSKQVYSGAPYSISTDDLNGDGRLDMVISDDATDRWLRNDGNAGDGQPNFTNFGLIADGFSGQSVIADLDNDGWKDVIVTDQDIDTDYVASRRTHIYHNNGAGNPNPQLSEVTSPAPVIPFNVADAVYNTAVFDIDRDGWRDVVFGRGVNQGGNHDAGSTIVLMNNGKPGITFTYPGGRPTNLTPSQVTNFNVQLTGNHGGSITGSPVVFHSMNGGAFSSTPLASLGGGLYQVTLPSLACGSSVRYYISAQTAGTPAATHVDPAAEGNVYSSTTPAMHYSASAGATSVLASENFEGAAAGWTVQNDGGLSGGGWELGDPNGTWNEGFRAAPEDDATAAGTKAYVTGLGAAGGAVASHDVDGGSTHLVSPTFDLSASNGIVTFKRWFYSSTAGDVLQVAVSNNNGGSWVNVVAYKPHPVVNWNGFSSEYTQTSWVDGSFVVSDYVTPTAQVKVRFSVNDTTPAGFVEAGIDDFLIEKTVCASTAAVAQCITYTTFGQGDRLLIVTIKIVDGGGNPLQGASVTAQVSGANGSGWTQTATSNASGNAVISRRLFNTCFTTDIQSVIKPGYTFDGTEPFNEFRKGIDSIPDADCAGASDGCGSG